MYAGSVTIVQLEKGSSTKAYVIEDDNTLSTAGKKSSKKLAKLLDDVTKKVTYQELYTGHVLGEAPDSDDGKTGLWGLTADAGAEVNEVFDELKAISAALEVEGYALHGTILYLGESDMDRTADKPSTGWCKSMIIFDTTGAHLVPIVHPQYNKYLKAMKKVLKTWKNDGQGCNGDEMLRQPLLHTLEALSKGTILDAAVVTLIGKVMSHPDLALAHSSPESLIDNPDTPSLRSLIRELVVARVTTEINFAAYYARLAVDFHNTPKIE